MIRLQATATMENFTEEGYLLCNADVAQAVRAGSIPSGLVHFQQFGQRESRPTFDTRALGEVRARKLARVASVLKADLTPERTADGKFDFLPDALRKEFNLAKDGPVSANEYDPFAIDMIDEFSSGMILDVGAGLRRNYYENVVNYEIFEFVSTDVIGVGEALPFSDASFDAVISIAVLEHVRDPFRCAREIVRVLKPGGRLYCVVPFLQPEHGFPHHYYNMAPQGLRALFEPALAIDHHRVIDSTLPIWTLTWFLRRWSEGLQGKAGARFRDLRIGDLADADPAALLSEDWVRELPEQRNFELASATAIFAHKPR